MNPVLPSLNPLAACHHHRIAKLLSDALPNAIISAIVIVGQSPWEGRETRWGRGKEGGHLPSPRKRVLLPYCLTCGATGFRTGVGTFAAVGRSRLATASRNNIN